MSSFVLYETGHNKSHAGNVEIQRRIVERFFRYMSSAYGLGCPSGRGSAPEAPLMVLISGKTRTKVYAKYVQKFEKLEKNCRVIVFWLLSSLSAPVLQVSEVMIQGPSDD